MAAVHMAFMKFIRQLPRIENLPQQDSAERAINKFARTFALQMETLKRYRTGGEQKVTVQHVSVSEGGQAIVGNVTQSPSKAAPESAPAKPAALAPPSEKPMKTLDEAAHRPSPIRRKSGK
jgi:hypothetical protein